jgi:hypothetical protein
VLAAAGGPAGRAPVDLVLSDMAPNMSGVERWTSRVRCIWRTGDGLRRGHLRARRHLPDQAVPGRRVRRLRAGLRKRYAKVAIRKPAASRKRSPEVYAWRSGGVVCAIKGTGLPRRRRERREERTVHERSCEELLIGRRPGPGLHAPDAGPAHRRAAAGAADVLRQEPRRKGAMSFGARAPSCRARTRSRSPSPTSPVSTRPRRKSANWSSSCATRASSRSWAARSRAAC